MLRILVYICLSSILVSCAQYGRPGGGPKDEDPPYIVKETSEANYQTRFDKKYFELGFNEWIQLSNPINEVVISPPTSYPLQINTRGKAVTVRFSEDEELKQDATYQINFGDAVRDFTEGNIYKNLVFVFSTGDVIDSLSVSGTITDALTGEPREDIVVCLYDNLSDSCFLQQKPFYFTKTDKSGRYKLNNIKNDTFQIFALKDENVNYYYDLSTEEAGYLDSLVFLQDSSQINIDIQIFNEEDLPRLVESKEQNRGLIKLYYNPKPHNYDIQVSDTSIFYHYEEIKDSIYLWHNLITQDSCFFYVNFDETIDTIKSKKLKNDLSKLSIGFDNAIKDVITFHREDSLEILFNRPIAELNDTLIRLADTLKNYQISSASIAGRKALLKFDSLKIKHDYELIFYPGSVKDIYGKENEDSLKLTIKTHDPERFGNISLNFKNDGDTQYIAKFISGSNILSQDTINSDRTVTFEKLSSGSYKLEIIQDLNRDGRWTSGNIVQKRPPETIKQVNLDELKAGWDLELDVIIKDIFNETELE